MPKSSKKSEESTSKPKKAAARLKAKSVSKALASKKSKKASVFRHRKLTKRILRNRVKKVFKNKSKVPRGVVYLGHVPHGFYEDEMREFFSQFGKVTNINIPRSSVSCSQKCIVLALYVMINTRITLTENWEIPWICVCRILLSGSCENCRRNYE